eukprot:gene11832-11976_t
MIGKWLVLWCTVQQQMKHLLECLPVRMLAQTPLRDTLNREGFTDALLLAQYAEAGLENIAPNVTLTVLVPSNEAIAQFLKNMNLTMAEMQSRPFLSAAIVGYHIIPRVKATASDVMGATQASPIYAATASPNAALKFYMDKNNKTVVVEDAQGHTARVIRPNINAGRSIIHVIDRVMLSGDVFLNTSLFLERHPAFKEMRRELGKLGLYDQLKQGGLQMTVFAPTDAAFKAAGAKYSALTDQQKKDVLLYHVLSMPHALPAQMKPGQGYATLFKGHNIKIDYERVPLTQPAQKNSSRSPANVEYGLKVYVLPETGRAGGAKAQVVLANIFANRIIIHGIDQVMLPDTVQEATSRATAQESSKAARPPANVKAATSTAAVVKPDGRSSGRRLLARLAGGLVQYASGFPFSHHGQVHPLSRKLQQFGSSVSGISLTSVAVTSTQSSIRAAVDGMSTANDAASAGIWNSRSASVRCFNCITQRDMADSGVWGR